MCVCVKASLLLHGARIGFFQGDVKKLVGDIQELKPTVFVSVPRLLNRIYDKVCVCVYVWLLSCNHGNVIWSGNNGCVFFSGEEMAV